MKSANVFSSIFLTAGLVATPCVSHADLLGLIPLEPTISFSGSGMIDYNASTGTVTISGDPSALLSNDIFGEILGTGADDVKYINISFQVDGSGNVIADSAPYNLEIKGSIDVDWDGVADYTGVLLTATVAQFGFADGTAGGDDSFELRLNNISGALADFYTGVDLGISISSEVSAEYNTPFAGSFGSDWQGQAKGVIGAVEAVTIPPVAGGCQIRLVSKCSVDGGPYKDKCRIKVTRSPKHWEKCEYTHDSKVFHKSKYGMHGDTVPSWSTKYPSTDVKFKYTVSNDGSNPISNIAIEDSFDTPVTGYPTSLAVGASFTVIRTVALQEGLENDVNVLGSFGGEMCGADDVVTVKDKLRERRKYDDDDYKDKGRRDHD